jgi:EAL and modified HD-GYP domain-containing signal transduction protein
MTNVRKHDSPAVGALKSVYVARQPIFDRNLNVVAYELLFRTGFNNVYDNLNDGDIASSKTIMNSFVTLGIDLVTGGKPVFINFTKNLIIDETPIIFPREILTVEILEDIPAEKKVIDACRKIKRHGYIIALDDFVFKPDFLPLIEIADIIKVDFRISNIEQRKDLIEKIGKGRITYLAEKVETNEEFLNAKAMGFSLFQGYFFSKPYIVEGHELPAGKVHYMQVLRELNAPDTDFEILEHIVKRDISLTYKLLRFINSAAFGFQVKIQSILQALTLLGLDEFRKWASLMVLAELGTDKPEELVINTMMRAKFCEFLASKVNLKESRNDLFLLGLFSNITAFIDLPMETIVSDLPLSDEIRNALCGRSNRLSETLDIVVSYEKGNWPQWTEMLSRYNIPEKEFPEIYANTIDWVNKIYK